MINEITSIGWNPGGYPEVRNKKKIKSVHNRNIDLAIGNKGYP